MIRAAASPILALVIVAALAPPSRAVAQAERGAWYAGVGFGPARGALHGRLFQETREWWWSTGSTPQIRFGRVLGRHFALGLEAQTWFSEFGTAGNDLPLQLKLRFTGHLWALAGSWYPGPPDTFWGRFFVRVGAGPAVANGAAAIPDPSDPQGAREIQARIDEWGWGVVVVLGHEVRVARNFAAGLQISSNHLVIRDDVETVWYGGPSLHLLWYF